jgi:hypothetical protein
MECCKNSLSRFGKKFANWRKICRKSNSKKSKKQNKKKPLKILVQEIEKLFQRQ